MESVVHYRQADFLEMPGAFRNENPRGSRSEAAQPFPARTQQVNPQ
jgi:hypothetical protein